jgi:hypothetical protein
VRRRLLPAALAVAALLAPASAAAAEPPRFGVTLPGDAAAAAVRADPSTWIVGARPGTAADEVARRHGARRAGTGSYVVTRGAARRLAAAPYNAATNGNGTTAPHRIEGLPRRGFAAA